MHGQSCTEQFGRKQAGAPLLPLALALPPLLLSPMLAASLVPKLLPIPLSDKVPSCCEAHRSWLKAGAAAGWVAGLEDPAAIAAAAAAATGRSAAASCGEPSLQAAASMMP